MSHTLGVGTVGAWSSLRDGGTWIGPHANARMQLYEGAGANIGCDAQHFWLYGLNYDHEDGYLARIRHVRMVAALRWDMGLVTDSDGDGLPDDWERFHFRTLAHRGTDDTDADGISNAGEYQADTDPGDGISPQTTILVVNRVSAAGQASHDFGPATVSALFGAGTATPNALINSGNLTYLGVNSSAFPTDGNLNAINDRDGAPGGADQERLRIAIHARRALAGLTWNWSRADGPQPADGVTITGFRSNPGAVFSGGISAAAPVYAAGKLTFQITAFNSAVHSVTFTNRAASSNATLEITVADSTQAGPQFALQSLSFLDLNRAPVTMGIPLAAPLGGSATVAVLGGVHAPTDPDGDPLVVSTVGPAVHGVVAFSPTHITYTSTNAALSDSFAYVVADAFGGTATNTVTVTVYTPAGFNALLGLTRQGDGALAFNYRGIAQRRYALEVTDHLTPPISWTPALTNTAATDGFLGFTNLTGSAQGFFRIRELP